MDGPRGLEQADCRRPGQRRGAAGAALCRRDEGDHGRDEDQRQPGLICKASGPQRRRRRCAGQEASQAGAERHARDRIGAGPWFNAKGARIAQNVADLHGDTLEQARRGNNIQKPTAITEKGEVVNGVGDTPNQHDMITGSQLDGTAFTDGADHTCGNYSSSATTGTVQLGHHDRTGGGNISWNSTHASRGCSQENLVATGGAGRFYCFAIN